ncbi:MAG: penicillin-binding protein 2 [Clostridia bacterium]|nr:penicillin-binding protein 2 [Clostridia bacterium]
MHKRLIALFASLLFAFSGIIARVYRLTEQGYAEVADVQSSLTVTVATARGTLYDRHMIALTNTGTQYAAGVISTPEALAVLSESMTVEEWAVTRERLESGKPAVLTSENAFPLANGIRQFVVPQRYNSNLASHIVGYVDADGHGVCGAERALDEVLSAASGKLTVTYRTDGTGSVLTGGEVIVENTLRKAKAGAALTVDSRMQAMLEAEVGKHISRGAAVVLDVRSGDILAMASFPGYDPTDLTAYLDDEAAPLFDRTTAAYNCGSVFKIVTAMAALERGTPTSVSFNCAGAIQVGSNRIKCHHILGHGTVDLLGAFRESCNPYFIQLAHRGGASSLYRYASLLGFDSPLFLMNGWQTARATLPQETELLQATRLANVSIGQGDLLATPLHIAAMTACVARGGSYLRPNLYLGTVDAQGNLTRATTDPPSRICSEQTAATLRRMMEEVVSDGTGTAAAPSIGTAAGKTGTAETGWRTEDGDTMVHSWFTGYYPAESPQYVITVLAENGSRTDEATAPVFAVLCDRLYRMGYVKMP